MICNGGEIAGRPENYGRAVSGRWEKVSEDPPHQREKSKIEHFRKSRAPSAVE